MTAVLPSQRNPRPIPFTPNIASYRPLKKHIGVAGENVKHDAVATAPLPPPPEKVTVGVESYWPVAVINTAVTTVPVRCATAVAVGEPALIVTVGFEE